MAQRNAQSRSKYVQSLVQTYAAALVWRGITNRNFEGDAQNAKTLEAVGTTTSFSAQRTNRNTDAASRNPALPDHQTTGRETQTFDMDIVEQISVFEEDMDITEGPNDVLPKATRDALYAVAQDVDVQLRAKFIAGVPSGQDGNSTASLRLGDASNYVDANGMPNTVAARNLLPNAIRLVGHMYRSAHKWKTNDPQYDSNAPILVVDNALATAFNVWADYAPNNEMLVNRFFDTDGVQPAGFFVSYKGIPMMIDPSLPLLTQGGKQHHQMLVTNINAMTAAFRVDRIMENGPGAIVLVQSNSGADYSRRIGWEMNARTVAGALVVNPNDTYRFLVRAEA